MKRLITIILLCCTLLLSVRAYATDESRAYEFELSVNGKQEIEAEPGDIITVTAYLHRTDSSDKAVIYAIQNEIYYNSDLLEIVDGGAIMAPGIVTTDIAINDTERAFYINFASFSGGADWEADKLLGSFQMRVLGEKGTPQLQQRNCIVSNSDGTDSFAVTTKDVVVRLPNPEPEKEDKQTEETQQSKEEIRIIEPVIEDKKPERRVVGLVILGVGLIGTAFVVTIIFLKRQKRE